MKITADRKLMIVLSAALIVFTISGALMGRVVAVEGTYSYLKLFNEALYLVVNNYVQPVDMDALMQGAYRGMLESIDPANEYLDPRTYQKAARGESAGPAEVGVAVAKRRGYIAVLGIAKGSPAAEAGLTVGDVIITIDGRSTRLMGAWEAAQTLRGQSGSRTTLTLNAVEGTGRRSATLTRKVLADPAPTMSFDASDVAVAKLAGIHEGDARRLDQGLAGARKRGATRLLLDLRGCASDALAESIGVASLFMRDGTVVTVADRYEGDKAYRADGRRVAWDRPLVVLVGPGTAGTCELLAAALHDGAGASLLGERTWGLGSITRLLPLQHGDGVLLAVGKFVSPAGKEWNGKGIQPDLVVDHDASDASDGQKRKAIDYLRGISLEGGKKAA